MERLVREGKLQHLVKCDSGKDKMDKKKSMGRINMLRITHHSGRIGTISGSISREETPGSSASPSQRSRKRNARTSKWTREVFNVHYAQQAKTPKKGWSEITFSELEDVYAARPHSDPLIIEARIEGYDVARILVDTGAAVNVLFHHAYSQFNHKANRLEFCNESVISFSGESTFPLVW